MCPTFGAPLIKRVLDNFVPDEFCPDPIPDAVHEALDSEVSQILNLFTPARPFSYPSRSTSEELLHLCMILIIFNAFLLVLPWELGGLADSGPKFSTMVLFCILAFLLRKD